MKGQITCKAVFSKWARALYYHGILAATESPKTEIPPTNPFLSPPSTLLADDGLLLIRCIKGMADADDEGLLLEDKSHHFIYSIS